MINFTILINVYQTADYIYTVINFVELEFLIVWMIDEHPKVKNKRTENINMSYFRTRITLHLTQCLLFTSVKSIYMIM